MISSSQKLINVNKMRLMNAKTCSFVLLLALPPVT